MARRGPGATAAEQCGHVPMVPAPVIGTPSSEAISLAQVHMLVRRVAQYCNALGRTVSLISSTVLVCEAAPAALPLGLLGGS